MSDHTEASSTPDYTMGYSEAYVNFLAETRGEMVIEFLQPHLRPGMRILDLGCGPGQVSLALAQAVFPGEMRGIDMAPS